MPILIPEAESVTFPRLAGIGGFISYSTTNGGSISLPRPILL